MTAERSGWVPAFPGQRPPFEPGNELTLKHGAFADRRVNPIAERIISETLAAEGNDYLRAPRWQLAVKAWARAEARVLLLTAWLEDNDGVGVDQEGAVMPVLTALKDWESRAEKARGKLGLDPLSASRLGRNLAATADVALAMAEMAREEARREETDDDA